ncbi:hypothetical protein [Methylobacterium sp. ID0610]|uniref:hypothetical protein n=1 Tax=Methylobacterium carpenticola TaxID=3344827 RepID=UPI0036754BB3
MSVLAALIFPLILGVCCLAVEFGHALLVRQQGQRVSDLAAYSAALAYNATGSTDTMKAAAGTVAELNGIAADKVTATLQPSPRGNGSQAVSVAIATTAQVFLGPVLGIDRQLAVTAMSYAEMQAGAPACILALSGTGSGLTLSGGTSLSAPSCAVASNATVTVPCGTEIRTSAVTYNSGAPPSQPCNGIRTQAGGAAKISRTATSDPFATHPRIQEAAARLATVRAMKAPAAPTVPAGTDIDFGYNTAATQSQAQKAGCSAAFSSSTWTLSCPHGATLNFGSVTMGGGISVKFNVDGSEGTVYTFSGSITNTGSMTFGPGTFRIAKGLYTGGGSTTQFGSGTVQIGEGTQGCDGSATYSICHKGNTLTFGGPSRFQLSNGLFVNGGATLTLGTGDANSFEIGAGSSGDAMVLRGGSTVSLGGATSYDSLFRLIGNLNVTGGGGSCLILGAAGQHDIQGSLMTAGGNVFGAGIYTVTGAIGLGANGGGDTTCNGSKVGLKATDVTFVVGGYPTPNSGNCSGQAFCASGGYGNTALTAPGSGATAHLLIIGPQSTGSTAGAAFSGGAKLSMAGIFYVPNGPLSLSGGSSINNANGQCLQIVASQITLSGGTAAGSTCTDSGTSGNGASVSIVQ